MSERAFWVAQEEPFAVALGTKVETIEPDRVVVRLPYREDFGDQRVHGGAISALVDIAATAAFWSTPAITENAWGATVGFDIHFLSMATAEDLLATATVRRRGGSLCTGEVTVAVVDGREVASATVTYKLSTGG